MAFISPADQERLRDRLAQELVDDVRLLLFTRRPSLLYVPGREEPVHVTETQALLEELTGLSPRISLTIHDVAAEPELAALYGVTRAPMIVALREAPNGRTSASEEPGAGLVRFLGLPAGYEFAVLVDDLVDLSRGSTPLSAATREQLSQLQESLHLQVFVTPT